MTTKRFAIGTIIGPIGVRLASELISTASAAVAAKMLSKVGSGFEILENSCGSCEMHQQ